MCIECISTGEQELALFWCCKLKLGRLKSTCKAFIFLLKTFIDNIGKNGLVIQTI